MSRKEELNFHKQKVPDFSPPYIFIYCTSKNSTAFKRRPPVFTGSLLSDTKIGFLLKFILPLGNVILVKTQRLS